MEIRRTGKRAVARHSFRYEKNFFNHIEDKLKDLGYEVLETAFNASRKKESRNALPEEIL